MKYLLLAASLLGSAVSAQTLKEIKLDMAQAQVGQIVTASVGLDAGDRANCGMRVIWGDGAITELRIEDKNAIPYQATHVYAKAGDYQVVADPQKIKSSLACIGKKVSAVVRVLAPPPPVAAATPMTRVSVGPSCPDGWRLNRKSVVRRTGAYGCTARPGTAAPANKPVCPGDLTYYESSRKGMLGCKP